MSMELNHPTASKQPREASAALHPPLCDQAKSGNLSQHQLEHERNHTSLVLGHVEVNLDSDEAKRMPPADPEELPKPHPTKARQGQ